MATALIVTGAAMCLTVLASGADASGLAELPSAWIWIVLHGLVLIPLIHGSLAVALTKISPTRTAIALTMEPVVAVALAAVLVGVSLSAQQLLGGVLIVVAAALQAMTRPGTVAGSPLVAPPVGLQPADGPLNLGIGGSESPPLDAPE